MILAYTLGDRRRDVAEVPKDLIAFLFPVLGCFFVKSKALSSNSWSFRARVVKGVLVICTCHGDI
jgi:hypothetical protein